MSIFRPVGITQGNREVRQLARGFHIHTSVSHLREAQRGPVKKSDSNDTVPPALRPPGLTTASGALSLGHHLGGAKGPAEGYRCLSQPSEGSGGSAVEYLGDLEVFPSLLTQFLHFTSGNTNHGKLLVFSSMSYDSYISIFPKPMLGKCSGIRWW